MSDKTKASSGPAVAARLAEAYEAHRRQLQMQGLALMQFRRALDLAVRDALTNPRHPFYEQRGYSQESWDAAVVETHTALVAQLNERNKRVATELERLEKLLDLLQEGREALGSGEDV